MTLDPCDAAFEASPFWLHRIKLYGALELGRCISLGHDASGREILERSNDADAPTASWTVYGHLKAGGVEAFDDFATEVDARAFIEQLEGLFPYLAS